MMLRSLVALSLLAATPAAAPPAQDTLLFVSYPLVHRVDCDEGRGTAFRIGGDHWLSVAHVAGLTHCAIDSAPITVTELDATNDFARLDTPLGVPNGFKVNCSGFIPGRWYWSIGFAYGLPVQTAIALYATYATDPSGRRVLVGPHTVIPGMSGGPLLNAAGEVVGLVNAYIPGTPISLSRDLRNTSICGADIA